MSVVFISPEPAFLYRSGNWIKLYLMFDISSDRQDKDRTCLSHKPCSCILTYAASAAFFNKVIKPSLSFISFRLLSSSCKFFIASNASNALSSLVDAA